MFIAGNQKYHQHFGYSGATLRTGAWHTKVVQDMSVANEVSYNTCIVPWPATQLVLPRLENGEHENSASTTGEMRH